MVDLIDEDDCFAAGSAEPISRRGHHFAHLRHITFHAAQANKFRVGHFGDDIRQSCFATSGWARNNQRRQPVSLDCATQEFSRREDMVLSDKFIERPWTNARREGSRRADALQVFRLAFGEQIVHRVKMYGEGSLGASVNMCATVVARIGDAGLARARKCGSQYGGAKTRKSDLHLAWLALYLNSPRVPEMRLGVLISILGVVICANAPGAVTLPMRTVFKGQGRFE